jgi:hypothetical protein
MVVEYRRLRCAKCGIELDEAPSTPVPDRQPCPTCGSMMRLAEVRIGSTLTLRSLLTFKARHDGRGRPFAEGKVGDDLHRTTRRWLRLERIIDRVRDWYREILSDRRTGEIVHHVEEPLSKHTSHGAARKVPGDKRDDDV